MIPTVCSITSGSYRRSQWKKENRCYRKSRTDRSADWQPLAPKLVAEVSYDHFSGDRFRHGTSFVRWRPDKAPRQCTMEQVKPPVANVSRMLRAPRR
jgi:ATP-dependent DNA ligase